MVPPSLVTAVWLLFISRRLFEFTIGILYRFPSDILNLDVGNGQNVIIGSPIYAEANRVPRIEIMDFLSLLGRSAEYSYSGGAA